CSICVAPSSRQVEPLLCSWIMAVSLIRSYASWALRPPGEHESLPCGGHGRPLSHCPRSSPRTCSIGRWHVLAVGRACGSPASAAVACDLGATARCLFPNVPCALGP